MGEFVEFAAGCDLLIHDAQFSPADFPERRGWGHSSFDEVVSLALKAGARSLLFTHHDPGRTDAQVRQIIEEARLLAATHNQPLNIDVAREGACFRLVKK